MKHIFSIMALMAFLVAFSALNMKQVTLGDTVKGPSDGNGKV